MVRLSPGKVVKTLMLGMLLLSISSLEAQELAPSRQFRVGAAAVDVSPTSFPVIVSGGFLQGTGTRMVQPLFARCLVLEDGRTTIAIVSVDSLMFTREYCDQVKQAIHSGTGIPAEKIVLAATHSHSAPSVMGALGTGVDEAYAKFLPERLVQSVVQAMTNRVAAQAGWAVVQAPEHTHCRQWILRPDKVRRDPFGELTVRSQMHPGYQNPDFLGPAGPAEPGLTLLSVRTKDGRPLAVLASFSQHYFGAAPVSSDYGGMLCKRLEARIGPGDPAHPPVAIFAQGTAGDQHWMDYSQPRKKDYGLEKYVEELVQLIVPAYERIRYRDDVPVAMAQTPLVLERRVPDARRLAWAQEIVAKMGDRLPKNQQEVYAREQVYLHETPRRELLLTAIRVGELGITAIPCEVFGITGLKLKAQSPLAATMNFELANGGEGYIPPPEQHPLGGYTTWPARTAALEPRAEPKIVETLLQLLEKVAGKPRRKVEDPACPFAQTVLASRPSFYWRLSEMQGTQAIDATGQGGYGTFEGPVARYLEGSPLPGLCGAGQTNRAVHLAGGRVSINLAKRLGDRYTAEIWFCNLLPNNVRPITGHLFSRGPDRAEHLAIGGSKEATGRLMFYTGQTPEAGQSLAGTTEIAAGTWHHVAIVREGKRVLVYLDGAKKPEIDGQSAGSSDGQTLCFGARSNDPSSLEGKLDEVAFYDRLLQAEEVASHALAARRPSPYSTAQVEAILAQAPQTPSPAPLRSLRVLLLADKKDHGPGEHDYPRWQACWSVLLGGKRPGQDRATTLMHEVRLSQEQERSPAPGASRVELSTASQWPSQEQFSAADLLVMFCYRSGGAAPRTWSRDRVEGLRAYLERGGGLVLIHSGTYTAEDLTVGDVHGQTALTGLSLDRLIRVRLGAIAAKITAAEHPICLGLPPVISFYDEPYWPPRGELGKVQVLATSDEASSQGEVKPQPLFWTYRPGKGRVFGCVLGHYDWTFDDPLFRLFVLRGMAWAAGESPYRFDRLALCR